MSTAVHNRPEGTYTFASQPRAVPQRRKFRNAQENDSPAPYGNIMYDRRIVRGNTYAQQILPASAQPDPIEIQRQQEQRRRAIARKRANQQLKPKSPEPVEGRKHIDVQTELYLEELSDRIEEADVECQTDAFLDRPPSPLFVPAKTGVDVETQILEGELFDFDIEVKPILEVLTGKTIEQSLLEVMEEEELANLRAQQREFEELRNAELVEQQRLEEQERRHKEEKERRMEQQRDILRKEKETADKIAARAFAQSYLADLVPSVFGTLADNGYFYDPVERDVEQNFLPWLMTQVDSKLQESVVSRAVLDELIRQVVRERTQAFREHDKTATPAPTTPHAQADGEPEVEVAAEPETTQTEEKQEAEETPQQEVSEEAPPVEQEETTEPAAEEEQPEQTEE